MTYPLLHRPRRLRSTEAIRKLTEESRLTPCDFVLPVFVTDDENPSEIVSMPGVYRWPISSIEEQVSTWINLGIRAFALFPKIETNHKDPIGKEILNPESLTYRTASRLRRKFSDILLIADLALDPYTTHGQDGVLLPDGTIDNDQTVEILADASLICANAGFDWVAPSDMMDGRIGAIREKLETNSFSNIGIIAYSAKFASSYYGPFRTAIQSDSSGKPVSKKTYQLNPCNFKEAKRELQLDFDEDADMLMVKPAEPYLDVIQYASQNFNIPIAAYQVSGEYSRIMAADKLGYLDWKLCALESLVSIKRAGASLIFSYFTDKIIAEL